MFYLLMYLLIYFSVIILVRRPSVCPYICFVCVSVRLSVCHVPVLYQNSLTYHTFFSVW